MTTIPCGCLSLRRKFIFIHDFAMNIRKKPKSQWTEGNGGSDKAACQQRCANMASVSPSVHIQPVTSAVITNVMPKTVEQKFPECKDSDQIHSFHHCKEKSCMLQDLEDELFAQEQVIKKLLVNMCTPLMTLR